MRWWVKGGKSGLFLSHLGKILIYFSADGSSYNLLTVAVAPQRHFQTSE